VTDELFPGMRVVQDDQARLRQLGAAVEDRAIGRDPNCLRSFDSRLIGWAPSLMAIEEKRGCNTLFHSGVRHLASELFGGRGVEHGAFGFAADPLADQQPWQGLSGAGGQFQCQVWIVLVILRIRTDHVSLM